MQTLISPLSIAPMIDWTNTHFRYFMRLIAPKALLYTEMITANAIIHNPSKGLNYQAAELPLVLQLGGSDPVKLVEAAKRGEQLGFSEINLNLGCPSNKVQAGQFGACLMANSGLVAECISAMKTAVSVPITAKTRIGIDNQDSYDFFAQFVKCLVNAGSDQLIVHARKAWLNGLNPKQNRTIPPVQYDYVYRIKQDYPTLPIVINGNVTTLDDIKTHMHYVDGVMLGRLACDNPYQLAEIHHYFYPEIPKPCRSEVLTHYLKHILLQVSIGVPLTILLKPLFNFNFGRPGAGAWKQQLMEVQRTKNVDLLEKAFSE